MVAVWFHPIATSCRKPESSSSSYPNLVSVGTSMEGSLRVVVDAIHIPTLDTTFVRRVLTSSGIAIPVLESRYSIACYAQ